MNRIQGVSRKYIVLLNVLIVAVPVGTLLYWMFLDSLSDGFIADLPVRPRNDLSSPQIMLAVIVAAIPMSVSLYALRTLRSLFLLYANGVIFSARNVGCFRKLGYALIAWVAAVAVYTPLISMVLSLSNEPGDRLVVVKFGFLDVSTLIVGGVVLIVSWVMNEGCRLQDEQAYTV